MIKKVAPYNEYIAVVIGYILVLKVIQSITEKQFPPNQLYIILEVIANEKETDEEVELPYIRFRFR